ncbi:acyl carrier protein [Mycobacterium vicinigordonae]|uniref:Acyl carrier protein n=1 Tax=Mycobacterium vicinigordonae TaxID=1719132 RepID=A0A7D6I8N5_9MYCO|nr:acyl carrier protein [Mycobacterium vicinigordonae]QLL07317.1 acyl carrier protein [Mycobacterium vicinigordonae]
MHADQTQGLADWLLSKISGYLNVAPETIDFDVPLADFGIDSAMSMSLCADLQCERGMLVDTTIVYDYPTINAIAAHLSGLGEP